MKRLRKQDDYSPLFEGLKRPEKDLRIEDRDGTSVLIILGAEVSGARQILERVRAGLLRSGGPRRLDIV